MRGETLSLQAILFNYSKRPATAKVTLDNSRGEFQFVEPANSLDDEQLSNRTQEARLVRVDAGGAASVAFLVRPTKLGALDVKLVAQSDELGDGLVRKLIVKPEGQAQHFNKAILVRLARGAGSEPSFKRNVSIQVPRNAVADSHKIQLAAMGDLLGAGLANVDDLLRLPYGCGEQNMINLVPNIVMHNYLLNTGRLREAQRARAVRNIETGYQRQLNYRRSDGSFSAFGPADSNGSVWLTAYVLRTFHQARSIISLDGSLLGQAANFVGRHARPDGSFEEVGMLHHKGLASASADKSPVYLTAYALSSLLEAGEGASPAAPSDASSTHAARLTDVEPQVVERGLEFLGRQLETSESVYELAIIACTMQLARRPQLADRAYTKLWDRANENQEAGLVWWSDSAEVAPSEAPESSESSRLLAQPVDWEPKQRGVGDIPPLKPLPVNSRHSSHLFAPDSLAVEATSWALLAAVRRGDLERALPVVRWLIGQQNSLGGFASTQDTVLAIEALAAFAQASGQSQLPLDMDVEFTYPRPKRSVSQLRTTDSESLHITKANALVQQQVLLNDNSSWVQVQASGTGVAVIQVSWQYNLLVSAEEPAFFLNPILDRSSTINYLQLSICTFYKAGEASNMAVVEVELPSGYVADAEALPGLKRHKSIKRIDTEEGETKVIVYLDKVTRKEELCFTVPAHRSTKVGNNKPVPVTIYDYYDRKQAARIFYEPQPASSCDICEADTCSDLCASKPKRSSKLISLHEQRRLNGRLMAEPKAPLGTSNGNRTMTTHSNLTDGTHLNVTVPFARDLLPLTPALESLRDMYRKAITPSR